MTTRLLRKEWVLGTSPELTRPAEERNLPGSREIPSATSSSSALGARTRSVVGGIAWLCRQICSAASRPYSFDQRSTNHVGWAWAAATACGEKTLTTEGTGENRGTLESLRRTALTKGAAEVLRARFTNSTLS